MSMEVTYSDYIYYLLQNWFENGFVYHLASKRSCIALLLINDIEIILVACWLTFFILVVRP